MRELRDRVAVVTGGGSGIGRGMALAFGEAGMHVVVADIEGPAAVAVRQELIGMGVRALAVRTDVSRREDLDILADRVYDTFGACHLLCNNAGVATIGPLHRTRDEDWRWVLGVNLYGVIHGLQACLPRMKRQEGEKHVVNTGSIAAVGPVPGFGPYVASKHAVLGLSDTLRAEGVAYGLSCSVLCPGNVRTGIVGSGRNRQAAYGGRDDQVNPDVQRAIDEGMDPLEVGRIVRQAVLDDDLFIFTHADSRDAIERRYEAMRAAQQKAEGGRRRWSAG